MSGGWIYCAESVEIRNPAAAMLVELDCCRHSHPFSTCRRPQGVLQANRKSAPRTNSTRHHKVLSGLR